MSNAGQLPLKGDLDAEPTAKTPAQMSEPPDDMGSPAPGPQQGPQQRPQAGKRQSPAAKSALDRAIDETMSVSYIPFQGTKEITVTLDDAMHVLANPTKSGKLPSYREVHLFLKWNEMQGLNPWVGDSFLVGYDSADGPKFSNITALAAMLKRAEANDNYDGHESGVLLWNKEPREILHWEGDVYPIKDEAFILLGSWCRVFRKDRSRPDYATCKLEAYAKEYGYWKKDGGWMIHKCAIAKAMRHAFSNQCQGMYLSEESGVIASNDPGEVREEPSRRRVNRLAAAGAV